MPQGLAPFQAGNLLCQLLRLGGLQAKGADVNGGLPVQKAGGDGQGGPLPVVQDRLLRESVGFVRSPPASQLALAAQ